MIRQRIAIGVLAALLVASAAGHILLLAMGRLGLDLGWGRSYHPLGPIAIRIDAPRELVHEMISAPYLGRAPEGPGIDVLVRDERMVVAAHHTKVHFYTARTVEIVEFDPPDWVGFRHLVGPVPYAVEEFRLTEEDGATNLEYTGEIGLDFFALGRLAARHWVRPQWERVVGDHLQDLKPRVEERARRGRSRDDSG